MNEMGWSEPTPIQIASVPAGLKGDDMFAQAQTGTGKTGAYGSIILGRIKHDAVQPSALVLVPTRELAIQVSQELFKLSKYTGHRCIPVYGGATISTQIVKLRRGTDIVVATPGRAKDLMARRDLDLSNVSIVVLDEADRMLDMGFIRDIDFILSKVPKKRQSLLFSATMSPDIKKLAMRHMVNAREILVSKDEPVLDLTKQYYIMATREGKRDALCAILDRDKPKTIVFCHTKRRVDQLTKKLIADGYKAGAIHGDVAQNKRERVLKSFKDGGMDILVATDVAARGLDIDSVECVVNFDAPIDPDTYVHRIGRTGRAGKEGISVSIFTSEERQIIKQISSKTGKPIEQLDIEVVHRPEPDTKRIRVDQNVHPAQAQTRRSVWTEGRPAAASGGFIEINLGKADGVTKADVAELIRTSTDLTSRDIGSIAMGERYSHVEIIKKDTGSVIANFHGRSYKGKAVEVRSV